MLSALMLLMILGAVVNSGNIFNLATGEISSISRVPRNDGISITSLLQKFATQIQNLQAELTTTRNDMAAAKSEHERTAQNQSSLIQNLQAELTKITTTTADKLQTAQSRIQQLETTVKLQQAVAFSVRFSFDEKDYGVRLSNHERLIFDDVQTNVGQAYKPTTGIFVAPINGSYALFLSLMAPQKSVTYLEIVTNHMILAVISAVPETYDQGSNLVTTHLVQGDQVFVRHWMGVGVRGGRWTMFSGFLLNADL